MECSPSLSIMILLVLSSTLTAVWGQPVYLSLGSITITTNNTEIFITDIGEDFNDLPRLTCHTDLVACCRNNDTGVQGGLGEWYYPDGTVVPNNAAGENFYRVRNAPQVVRLARHRGLSPTGSYCCVIPTNGGEMTFCANLVATCMWSGTESSCIAICVDLPSLTNGMITYNPSNTPRLQGDTATYSCDNGFQLSGGDTVRTCGFNRQWSGTAPMCVPDDCPSLTINNGMVAYSSTVSPRPTGATATVSCNSGYHLVGDPVRTCQDNGWDEMNPTCTRTCSDLPTLTNGMITYSPSTTPRLQGATATHSCNDGYQASSSSLTRTCLSSGSWSGVDITCAALCPDLPTLTNGMITYNPSTTPRLTNTSTVATHSCSQGYELTGNTVRTCGANGQWSGTAPTCDLIVSCGSPPSISNGSPVTPTSTLPGGTVTYNCDNGFILTGSATVTCQASGSWSTQPMCQTPPPVYLSLSSTNYLSSLSEVPLSSIGEGSGDSLMCHTDLTICCRQLDSGVEGGLGEWYYPNGSAVQSGSDGGEIYTSRDDRMVVSLNRKAMANGPGGLYCCVVPTSTGTLSSCLNLVSPSSPNPQSDNTGAIVGGGVVLVIVLAIVVAISTVLITYLVLKHNRERELKGVPEEVALGDRGQSSPQTYETVDVAYEEIGPPKAGVAKGTYNYTQNQAYGTTTGPMREGGGAGGVESSIYDN